MKLVAIDGSAILQFFLLDRACGFEIWRYTSEVITRRAARQFRAVAPTDPLQTGSGGPGISRWSNPPSETNSRRHPCENLKCGQLARESLTDPKWR